MKHNNSNNNNNNNINHDVVSSNLVRKSPQ